MQMQMRRITKWSWVGTLNWIIIVISLQRLKGWGMRRILELSTNKISDCWKKSRSCLETINSTSGKWKINCQIQSLTSKDSPEPFKSSSKKSDKKIISLMSFLNCKRVTNSLFKRSSQLKKVSKLFNKRSSKRRKL